MAVYSLFIIFIVIFMPRGIPFYLSQLWRTEEQNSMDEILKVRQLTVRFGGLAAVDSVDFSIFRK